MYLQILTNSFYLKKFRLFIYQKFFEFLNPLTVLDENLKENPKYPIRSIR